MAAVKLNMNNFPDEVIKSTIPVLVDFWAEWCGPCRMIAPIVEEIAQEMAGKLKVAKVNVDEAPELAGEYNIMSIPTLLLFKNGQVVDQMVGALGKAPLLERIKKHLG